VEVSVAETIDQVAAAPLVDTDIAVVGPDFFIAKNGSRYAGGHLLLDLWEAQNLTDPPAIERALSQAARAAGATILHAHLHQFAGTGGVSGVVVLAESHISIHTWPERGFAAIDIFMCGACDPQRSVPILRDAFLPGKLEISEHRRGLLR
jgi:S-adenosylmethionine decarboxylase